MGASLALAGLGMAGSGCNVQDMPPRVILPYVRQPENLVQGKPLFYATAVSLGGFGTGVVARTHEGRPTFLEGNEAHPDSLGAIDYLTQSSILGLYDPDRSQVMMRGRENGTFDGFLLAAFNVLDTLRGAKGAGLRLLTTTVTSPSLARQIRALLEDFPKAVWHQYEPVGRGSSRAGLMLAFGRDLSVRHHLDRANVILSLDSDFLACGEGNVRDARGFAARREPNATEGMNRLYVVEPLMTVTGATADHRLPLKARDVLPFALALARKVGVKGLKEAASPPSPDVASWGAFLDALAKDLQKGKGLVLAGPGQPPYVHALAAALNHALGSDGEGGTVEYARPVEAEPVDPIASLTDLCQAMNQSQVQALFILGGNPAYNTPADLRFTEGLGKVPFKVRLGLHEDETSALCDWHIPEAHELETWGDVRASDGTATIQQPLIAPLYGGLSAVELIAALRQHPSRTGFEIVRDTWRDLASRGAEKNADFESFWKTAIHDGVVAGTRFEAEKVVPRGDLGPAPALPPTEGLEIVFRPDPTIWDGRYANNGWLQELPKPITKLTWDNAALLSLATAERLGVTTGDVIELSYQGRKVEAPVLILPGHARDSLTIHFGYGRSRTGRVAAGAGFNAFAVWTADAPGFGASLSVQKTGKTRTLAITQLHRAVDMALQGEEQKKRGLVQVRTLDEFLNHSGPAHGGGHIDEPPREETLYHDDFTPVRPIVPDYQWGMVVNLNACTGCGSCVLACQAENNIPVVGKTEVLRSREMHWIEIDRYFEGSPDEPEVHHQPRLCMHCENAPCEVVCPVAATVHDHEGLNTMVYNRCVGTRYCSNNCPYKVRHFNFLQYADLRTPSLALLNNPDVTVRARGVMEKCTYCVQRINQARYTAEIENRRVRDGEVVTACQSACPTRAIIFGDITDPESAVSRHKADTRNYGMLAELNTRPRTTYLWKLKNPNPDLETEARHGV
ncbi:MAG: TAT-variant-translocated molybdopterin oxidoreductase [Isosphaeraceae bacterium]